MTEEETTKEEAQATINERGELSGAQQLPPPNFSTFILSLSTSVLLDLGEIEHPATGKKEQKLDLAKHSIDMLAMFKDKTEGNLTDDESELINNILTDLRLRYINASKAEATEALGESKE